MNTTQLHYFMTLSQTLNYSTAAQQLFITQPTLSRSIMALEDEIGTKLFFRENGNVSLTPAGKLMQEELKPLSARYETMLQHLRNRGSGLTGELTIAISNEQQFPDRLIQSVRSFMHTYPNIGVQFRRVDMGMMTAALQEGLVDLVVGLAFGGDAKKAGIESVLIAEEAPCLVQPVLGAGDFRKTITSEECRGLLQTHKLVFPSPFPLDADQGSPIRALQDMLQLRELTPEVMYVPDISAVSAYVAVGLGITITNCTHTIARESGIEMLEILGARPYRKVMQYLAHSKNPVLGQFLQFYQDKTHWK